jgi:nicotinate-nucleotide adenylyltransferase
MSRKLIFGGAFNPVHIGHLHAAREVAATLAFDGIELVPSYLPLHKTVQNLLPFDLRAALLRAAIEECPGFSVNTIERGLPTPSITVQTLEAMRRDQPAVDHHFLLGDREFLRLHLWRAGPRVVEMAHIAVVCRTEFDLEEFAAQVVGAWPGSRRIAAPPGAGMAFELLPGRRAVVISIPRIDISSSQVRETWLGGRDVTRMLPGAVADLLEKHRDTVQSTWAAAGSDLRAS